MKLDQKEIEGLIRPFVDEQREYGRVLAFSTSSTENMVRGAYELGHERGYDLCHFEHAAALQKGAQEHASKVVIGKPPTGLRPEAVAMNEANAARIHEIRQAMGRYIEADKEFPAEWVEELHRRSAKPEGGINRPSGWCITPAGGNMFAGGGQ